MSKQMDKASEADATVSSASPKKGEAGQEPEQEKNESGPGAPEAGAEQEAAQVAPSPQEERDEARQRIGELENRVAELEQENSELKEKYLRKQADFENFRKRMQREKEEFGAYANKQLLLDLVNVIDDFERAIESAKESRDFDSFHDGIVLIEKQMTGMLERKWGLQRFDSEGEEFDPQKHEAVTAERASEQPDPVVVEDYQKGYMLHDRVLRAAKVKVLMPDPEAGEADQNGSGKGAQEGPGDSDSGGSSDSDN